MGNIEKNFFDKEIVFKNVSFSYDGVKDAISDINIIIEKNKKYAIVGPSGSGKSTLLKILLKYYNDYKGDVLVDSIQLKEINSSSWYKLVSIIHQNVLLFNGTIRENISLYQDFSDEEINNAVLLSGLKKLVEKLEDGLDSKVAEAGQNLSGGEKQRIAIARALIKKMPILVLDEATSFLVNIMAANSILREKGTGKVY